MSLTKTAILTVLVSASVGATTNLARPVAVYFNDYADVPPGILARAQRQASATFADIGVTVEWRRASRPRKETGAIDLRLLAASTLQLPGCLGYAAPGDGINVGIFWNRIREDPFSTRLLAHVMTHEIAHILQGVRHHAPEGIMRSGLTREDRETLRSRPLSFTALDVKLIYDGIDATRARNTGMEAEPGIGIMTG